MPNDMSKMLRNRRRRMTMDPSMIPTLEPNLLHLHDSRVESGPGNASLLVETEHSPIAEVPGEEYEEARLKERILKSIEKDQLEFIKRTRRHAAVSSVSRSHQHPSEEEDSLQNGQLMEQLAR